MLSRLLLALGTALLALPAAAQTTHLVDNGPSFSFAPKHLTIQVGDTVTWVWKGGAHSVYSSTGGLPNGIFGSGAVTSVAGHTFSVTFDQAFLTANPVPNDLYEYICTIHVSLGQTGTVKVEWPAAVASYGCSAPAGSLTNVAGAPQVGGAWSLGVDNPFGTQGAGSLAFLAMSTKAAPGYPCGLALPGFGMAGAGAAGELLIDLTAPNPVLQVGPVAYDGASPAVFALNLPSLPSLAGATVFAQGVVVDAAPGARVTFGLTDGIAATIGS
jgi:plastocyanin